MIHDVTIPFRFDTSPIEAQVAAIGLDEVTKLIDKVVKEGLREALPTAYGYSSRNKSGVDWHRYVDNYMDKWMERHKEEVIDEAALLMAMRGSRKLKWREVLDEYRAERS